MFDIIVIGGGPAGIRAAHRARQLGADAALVERGRLGGTAINDGVAPTRTLARAARFLRDAETRFGEYGITYRDLRLDFPTLMAKAKRVVEDIHENHLFQEHLEDVGVKVFAGAGEARFVDKHTICLGDGRQLQAEKFIVCVGGHARRLEFPGCELAVNHHDLWSLEALPKSLVVVGGAATGCQVASICARFGVKVTLLEASDRIVAVEDEQISNVVAMIFEQRGIDVITGIGGVERVERAGQQLRLSYKHEGQIKNIEAAAVFVAVGWPGNVDVLNLGAVGVETERSYIKTNEYLQSTAPNIYAAGDINGKMMLVQCAKVEADIAAENALLGNSRTYSPILVSHGSFTHPEYASVGLTEKQARAGHDCAVVVVPFSELDRAIIDDHTEGFFKLVVDRQTHRILGAHVVGEQATDIAQMVAGAMQAHCRIDDLSRLELAYPTYTSVVSIAASRLASELGVDVMAPAERIHADGKTYDEAESYAAHAL